MIAQYALLGIFDKKSSKLYFKQIAFLNILYSKHIISYEQYLIYHKM